MTRPVTIGVQLQQEHAPYSKIRETVTELENLGIDTLYNWDHFFPLYGDPDGANYEGLTLTAAWAEQTSRVQLGNLVLCNSYRNPHLLADMARTIDNISDGRFLLGIGAGWFEKDYTEYDYEFGTAGKRLDHLRDNLPIIVDRLNKLNPAPVRKIPILIGGGGEKKTLPLVAQYADIWHYFVDEESYKRKTQLLEQYCKDIGRNPADIEHSASVDQTNPNTPPASYADSAQKLYDWGITHIIASTDGPNYNLDGIKELVRWRDNLKA